MQNYVFLENIASTQCKWTIYHCSENELIESLNKDFENLDLPYSNAEIMILSKLVALANNEKIPFMPDRFNAILKSMKILRGDVLIAPDYLRLIPNQEISYE